MHTSLKHYSVERTIAAAGCLAIALNMFAICAHGQESSVTPAQIDAGSKLYSRNCAPCHGARMADPEGAFDLRKFPPDQHSRFINSVTNGKNSMPPWGGLFSPEDIENLWAYVVAGEK